MEFVDARTIYQKAFEEIVETIQSRNALIAEELDPLDRRIADRAEQIHGAIAQCVNLASGNLEGARSGGRALREGGATGFRSDPASLSARWVAAARPMPENRRVPARATVEARTGYRALGSNSSMNSVNV